MKSVCFVKYVFLCVLSSKAMAQYFGANGSTVVPVPGKGHDYMHMVNETVDPASGSTSIRITVPIPPGRGLSLPFSFNYDSNGLYVPTWQLNGSTSPGLYPTWYQVVLDAPPGVTGGVIWVYGGPEVLSSGGWSYTIPSAGPPITAAFANYSIPQNPPIETLVCHVSENYTFLDASGGRHSLGMRVNEESNPICEDYPNQLLGGGVDYFASINAAEVNFPSGGLLLADKDGTTYSFSGGACLLPKQIEDRNGNIIHVSNTSCTGPITETDTLGRTVLSTSGFGGPSDTIKVSGSASPYVVTWGTATTNYDPHSSVQSPANCALMPLVAKSTAVPLSITLPNQDQYTFSYDATYGVIDKITYPTGAWIKYDWGLNIGAAFAGLPGKTGGSPYTCAYTYGKPVIQHRYVSFDGTTTALQQDFTYTTTPTANGALWSSKTTRVANRDPLRGTATTTYTYTPSAPDDPGLVDAAFPVTNYDIQVPVESSIVVGDYSGTTLQTINKTWLNAGHLTSAQTILDDGMSSTTLYSYTNSSPSVAYEEAYQLHETDEFAFGQGTSGVPLRKTITNYQPFGVSPAFPNYPSLFAKPCQTIVSGSGGNSAETDYLYDGGSTVCGVSSGQTTADVSSSLPSGTHDDTLFGSTVTVPRGNITSIVRKCAPSCADSVDSFSYDETGQMVSQADGRSASTTFSYLDNFGGTSSATGGTNAFVTSVTRPATGVNHTTSFQYDYASNVLTRSSDENSQASDFGYADSLKRLTDVYGPPSPQNGGARPHTKYGYVDGLGAQKIATDPLGDIETEYYDGVGQLIKTTNRNAETVEVSRDGMGRASSVSNPHLSSPSPTDGTTTYNYDALGRKTLQCQPDNGTSPSSCTAGTSYLQWLYAGNQTTSSDESRNSWVRTTDILGRLTQVVEPGSLTTSYSYDALGNLKCADQWGTTAVGSPCGSSHARQFTYDSLSRLLTATNPENGAVCYGVWSGSNCINGYDANGNLIAKTDARGVTTNYSYDALNRLVSKTYTNDASGALASCYQYDTLSGGGTNLIGRLTAEWTQKLASGASCPSAKPSTPITSRVLSAYDAMGRITSETQCVGSSCTKNYSSSPTYTYDLAGNLTLYSNLMGTAQFTNSYDTAGRLSTVTNTWTGAAQVAPLYPASLFSSPSYTPSGALSEAIYGTGLTLNRTYDSRLRVTGEIDTGVSGSGPATPGKAVISISGGVQSK